jgi:putative membrane protein
MYRGIDGFLGTRASLMLDVVVLAMFAVLPVLGVSIWLVKFRRRYALHKAIQLTLGTVLLLTVAAFEIDMRFFTDWRERAAASPLHADTLLYCLAVHLMFSVSTVLLWVAVIVAAVRRFPNPPQPSAHSRRHIFWARLAAADMVLTSVTGWIFYWLAFVASK